MTLDKLKPHESAKITAVGGSGALRHHLLDMGLTPQTEVTLQKVAPMGDPVQFELRGYELTLRLDEARKIEVGTPYQRTKNLPPDRYATVLRRTPAWVSSGNPRTTTFMSTPKPRLPIKN